MEMWIQLHDFSSESMGEASIEQTKEVLARFDWASEWAKADQLKRAGDRCLPGLGLTHEDGSVLHICPDRDGFYEIYYAYSVSKKVFGLIPYARSRTHEISGVTRVSAFEMIEHHFYGRKEAILKI